MCEMQFCSTATADASILIHLLKNVYNQINITSSVFGEVVEKGWSLAGSIETERAVHKSWIKVLDVIDKWKAREMAVAVTHGIHLANAETVQLDEKSRRVFC